MKPLLLLPIFSLFPPTSTIPLTNTNTNMHTGAGKPIYFLLAGDSTTAPQSTGGGGWGAGFLNTTLLSSSSSSSAAAASAFASGRNYGHDGATTATFRSRGDWATVLAAAENKTNEGWDVFVTIQFGHNDQKSTSNVTLAQYQANLERFVKDVNDVDATPVLVTPLTRRQFNNNKTPPVIVENLATQRNLTIQAALSTGSRMIDLNEASTKYCNEIGEEASWKYNLNAADYTHLNAWGSVVFGRIVSDLLVDKYADIKAVTRKNETLTDEIEEGMAARR